MAPIKHAKRLNLSASRPQKLAIGATITVHHQPQVRTSTDPVTRNGRRASSSAVIEPPLTRALASSSAARPRSSPISTRNRPAATAARAARRGCGASSANRRLGLRRAPQPRPNPPSLPLPQRHGQHDAASPRPSRIQPPSGSRSAPKACSDVGDVTRLAASAGVAAHNAADPRASRTGASCSRSTRGGSQTAAPRTRDSSPANRPDRWAGLSRGRRRS